MFDKYSIFTVEDLRDVIDEVEEDIAFLVKRIKDRGMTEDRKTRLVELYARRAELEAAVVIKELES